MFYTFGKMEPSIRVNGRVGKNMVKGHSLMEKGNGKEKSMKGNSRMDIDMVKEHTPGLLETSM